MGLFGVVMLVVVGGGRSAVGSGGEESVVVCVVGTGHRRTRRSWHRGFGCSCRFVLSECGVLCGEKVGGCGRRMSHCSSLSSRPARLQRRPDLTLPKLGDKHNGAERQEPNPFLPLFTTIESILSAEDQS